MALNGPYSLKNFHKSVLETAQKDLEQMERRSQAHRERFLATLEQNGSGEEAQQRGMQRTAAETQAREEGVVIANEALQSGLQKTMMASQAQKNGKAIADEALQSGQSRTDMLLARYRQQFGS